MKIAKLARVIGLGTLVGALSLGGVFYASEYDSIEEAILALRLKAESWQKQAGMNKAELNEMTDKYNTLEANYKAILSILNIQDGADIEEVKAKVQEIYNNATSTGIEGTNLMLESIAEALGITLTDSDMNENGVYKTDRILEELSKLEDELDKLEVAIGDLSVNLEAGDMEYSDDMSLTEKINYLIGQINLANDEQETIKKLAEDTLAEVEEASADYVYVEEEELPEELPPTEGGDNVVEEGVTPPTLDGEEGEGEETEYTEEEQAVIDALGEDMGTKVLDGTYNVKVRWYMSYAYYDVNDSNGNMIKTYKEGTTEYNALNNCSSITINQ